MGSSFGSMYCVGMNRKNTLYICVAGGGILTLFLFITYFSVLFKKEEFVVTPHEEESYHVITEEIVGSAAVIYDVSRDKVLAVKNHENLYPIASITKLIAALAVYPYLNEDDITILQSSDFDVAPNTGLRLGDRWRTIDLLSFSLVTSSNRGIRAIGRTFEEKVGVQLIDQMNQFARENSLLRTHFINPTGLDAHEKLAGSESSALDIAKIAGIIVNSQHEFAKQTVQEKSIFYSLGGTRYEAKNTNKILGSVSDNVLLSKTGFTDIAGGSLVMVFERRGTILAFVVLGSTRTGRFDDMEYLLNLEEELTASATEVY